jgi:hypothetical protein
MYQLYLMLVCMRYIPHGNINFRIFLAGELNEFNNNVLNKNGTINHYPAYKIFST